MLALKAENISKQYRLGQVGTGTLSHDLNRFWHQIRGKEDPYLRIGDSNDRTSVGESEYVWSLRDINFEIEQGDAVGIIGRNGAGKSTLLKLLSKVTKPTTGKIYTNGRIASLLEVGTGFHPEMTGRENIYLNGAILGMTRKEITRKFDEIVDFSGVERYIDTPVKRYSSGMYVRLAFAVAAHLESEILIVDEVLAVGDAEFQKKCLGKMGDVSKGEGRTVLFVSHNMAAVKNLCQTGIFLNKGCIDYTGEINNVVEFYMSNDEKVLFSKHVSFPVQNKKYQILSIENKNTDIFTQDTLVFEIEIKGTSELNQEMCITGSICNMEDVRLGSFFSKNITISNNKFILEIPNHNLTLGKYYLNLALSEGNVIKQNLSIVDNQYKCIGIEIIGFAKNNDTSAFLKWNPNWGHSYLESFIKPI